MQIGEIRERLKEEIVREMGFHDEDTALADCDISYLTDRGEFRNVLPEGTVEGLVEEILQDTDRYRFDMSFQYRGGRSVRRDDGVGIPLSYLDWSRYLSCGG